MKLMITGMFVAMLMLAGGCKNGQSRTNGNTGGETSNAETTGGDYMPAEYYLAFEDGRVPEHWRPCVMTQEPAGSSGEAEMSDVRTNRKFFTTKYHKTRPATADDIKVGATVFVLVKWGVAVRESGSAESNYKGDSYEWLETTVSGTEGLGSGLFQAPHREQNDIHISNARVAE